MGRATDCYDGLRNFNQVRPAVFDGGYAFASRWEPYLGAPGATEVPGLVAGDYVVKVIVPPGYSIVKEEDKNIDFGDSYVPSAPISGTASGPAAPVRTTATMPAAIPNCVGALHTVPAELELFSGVPVASTLKDADPTTPGLQRPLCDAKLVTLLDGQNGAANFFMFTRAPVAGHIVGFILDDTANEFDQASPQFGEKYAPPWLPVSIRDWTGREISRVYSDEFGLYNALVPSTYSANIPVPSGMSPNMLTVCLNDPTIPNAEGTFTPDPHFNPQYSQFCYTFQYMPGATTYLDTPVLPVGAFAGPDQFPVDCELPSGTPVINRVTGPASAGPFVPFGASFPQRILTIVSAGNVPVPDPAYGGVGSGTQKTITRDYSFGSSGFVTLGGIPVPVLSWTPNQIVVLVLPGMPTGELQITPTRASMASPSPAAIRRAESP
jgi:hypothetical protein